MEWMLQVVDEFDDAIGAMKHRWLGLSSEIGLLVGGPSAWLRSLDLAARFGVGS